MKAKAEGMAVTFLMLLKVPKSCSLCTMLESKGVADAVPSGMSHLQMIKLTRNSALSQAAKSCSAEYAHMVALEAIFRYRWHHTFIPWVQLRRHASCNIARRGWACLELCLELCLERC